MKQYVISKKGSEQFFFLREKDLLSKTGKDSVESALESLKEDYDYIEERDLLEQYNVNKLEEYLEKHYDNQPHLRFINMYIDQNEDISYASLEKEEAVQAFLDKLDKDGYATLMLSEFNTEEGIPMSAFIWTQSKSEIPPM